MGGKVYIIPILVGAWVNGVLGICSYHCLKKLEPARCSRIATSASNDYVTDYDGNSGNTDRDHIRLPDSFPNENPGNLDRDHLTLPESFLDKFSGIKDRDRDRIRLPDYENSRIKNRDHIRLPDYDNSGNDRVTLPDYSDSSPVEENPYGNDHTRLRPSPGKPEEVVNGLDINFNCRISDQGKLHFRFKLDDNHEHKCLSCFCYQNEPEGAEPGCNIVDKTKCYEMGLQIRPKSTRPKKRKYLIRSSPGTGARLWPFEQIARLHQSQRLAGLL